MLKRTIFSALAALAASAALAAPVAVASGSHGGAVVFSRVTTRTVTETVKDQEGNPVKDKEGKVEVKETKTVEGGLYAARDGRLNQLTEDPSDTEPSFSPDSRAIVFSRDGDVYAVRADGSGLRRLTSGPELDTAPRVSPNGRIVLFERSAAEGAPADLYTVRLNGGAPHALAAGPGDEHEASFSPDGRSVVYVRSNAVAGGDTADDLYTVRISGAERRRLTSTGRVDEFDPRWFAGGIVYSRGESGIGASAYADVYTMRADGTRVKPLVAGAGSAYVEDVTRDGHTVLFRRDQGLWVKRIGRGRARKLTDLPDGSLTRAVFSSDGLEVAAFVEAEGREQLASLDVRTGSTTELAEGFAAEEGSVENGSVTRLGPVITWQPSRR